MITTAKLNQLYPRHGGWIASMPKPEAEIAFSLVEELAEQRRNLSFKSAGELVEKVGIFELASKDARIANALKIAKAAGFTLTENGWEEKK